MNAINVFTIGDSTLDNRIWVDHSSKCVEEKLQTKLGDRYKVVSHAYDGFTTESVLKSDQVGRILPHSLPNRASYMEKKGEGEVKPLENLRHDVEAAQDKTNYVILSVGGNDFRERLANPIGLLQEVPHVQERYLEIVKEIRSLKGRDIRPILMLQYHPAVENNPYYIYPIFKWVGRVAVAINLLCPLVLLTLAYSYYKDKIGMKKCVFLGSLNSLLLFFNLRAVPIKVTKEVLKGNDVGMTVLDALLEKFYAPIIEQAKKDQLPILDLPNTLDPYDSKNYISGIEPGEQGGDIIAEGLNHIIKNHDFQGPSLTYSKPPRSTEPYASHDPSDWGVQYIAKD